jgi:hypothetical protein
MQQKCMLLLEFKKEGRQTLSILIVKKAVELHTLLKSGQRLNISQMQ